MRLFPKTTPVVEFCDSCGSVCDARCEVEADRERQTLALLTRGFASRERAAAGRVLPPARGGHPVRRRGCRDGGALQGARRSRTA
jgi:hypothetical protein